VLIEYDMLGNIIHVHNEYLKALPIFTFLGFLSQFNRFWGFGTEWVGSGVVNLCIQVINKGQHFIVISHNQVPPETCAREMRESCVYKKNDKIM